MCVGFGLRHVRVTSGTVEQDFIYTIQSTPYENEVNFKAILGT
jgi:hypothetical protein